MISLPENYWATRLQARIHDPAEKALVLMRTKGGHEAGSVATMRALFAEAGLEGADMNAVKRADHWASAADRLPWPRDFDHRYTDQVHFYRQPELRHPLCGAKYDLHHMNLDPAALAEHQSAALASLVVRDKDGQIDERLTALAIWRFGPELAPEGLGHLWRLLPADTRIPDHSIWQHLDLTAALAGAMVGDAQDAPALLTISIGPVQGFIAQARKTDDLWAGSHLLSQLAFEAARFISETLGPEQLIFPALRGVPIVDQWVVSQLREASFAARDELQALQIAPHSQQVAALPNRLLAIVPADKAEAIAKAIEERLQQWLQDIGGQTLDELIDDAQISDEEPVEFMVSQMKRQLDALLEFHWAAVPWTLAGTGADLDYESLASSLAHFYPHGDEKPGFMQSPLMQGLQLHAGNNVDDQLFWMPNPGVAYSAIHDIGNRALAAAKGNRQDSQMQEQGFRCSLCGEREILAIAPAHRFTPRGRRPAENGLWHRLGSARQSVANTDRGESLCGVCAVKRQWPTIWRKTLERQGHRVARRHIVSTHTMALTPRLVNLMETATADTEDTDRNEALPLALYNQSQSRRCWSQLQREIAASEDREHEDHDPDIDDGLYYGLLLFDGDRMGAWLNGDTKLHAQLVSVFHSRIATSAGKIVDKKGSEVLRHLLHSARSATPSLHASLSATLNDFAVGVVPELINRHYYGQLIYAGGDDVLAMLPHDQLLQAALAVRQCWSGVAQPGHGFSLPGDEHDGVRPSRGFVLLQRRNQLLRAMGQQASGSAGLVLVPATMPLGRALNAVRAAEQSAKNAGRDAFSISVIKRSGGTLRWSGRWPVPKQTDPLGNDINAERDLVANDMLLLIELIDKLDSDAVSPRFSFQLQAWARQLVVPWRNAGGQVEPAFIDMLSDSIAFQLERQGLKRVLQTDIARRIAQTVCAQPEPLESLRHLLGIAEFLVRKKAAPRIGEHSEAVAT